MALLRGINVGGKGKLPMDDLRAAVAGIGADDVATYIQSGNVVFTSAVPAARLLGDLEQAIAEAAGFEVPVVLRSAEQLAGVVAANPFLDLGLEGSRLHVVFLKGAPAPGALDVVDAAAFEPERFALVGEELYLALPDGIGRSKLAAKVGERVLGVPGTARNWNTVLKLVDLLPTP